jgi:uncharacterized membrane protein required for colicin V production
MDLLPSVIDIIALVLVVLGAIVGYRRRLSGELAHVVSIVAALLLGLFFHRPIGLWLSENTRLSEPGARAAAFIATTLVAAVTLILVRAVLRRVMRVVMEEEADKTAGCVAGAIRAAVVVLIVFIFMNMVPHDYLNKVFGERSVIGRMVLACMPSLREAIDEGLQEAETIADGMRRNEETED